MFKIKKFLIVGLGNPGKKYQKTRHNVGRLVLEWLKKDAEIGERAEFFIPQTFMNESGAAVLLKMRQTGIQPDDLIVIHDDVDIGAGEWRLQKNRSSAGHKGAESIIGALGTSDFWRVRIGISRPLQGEETESYVLEPLSDSEYGELKKLAGSEKFTADLRQVMEAEE